MSVLIKGMEMPKNCMDCPMNYDSIDCVLVFDISLRDKDNEFMYEDKRHPKCPLIELPSHGRLIDADAVYKVIKEDEEWVVSNFDDEEQTLLLGYQCAYGRSRRMIHHAPTIIEVEE